MGLGSRANGTLPAVAVIPLKGLEDAKSRLGGVLSRAERAEVALQLLARVVAACQDAGLAVCVISPDPQARAEAARLGAETLDDGGVDLTCARSRSGSSATPGRRPSSRSPPTFRSSRPTTCVSCSRWPGRSSWRRRPTARRTRPRPARPPRLRPSYGPGSAARHGGRHVALPRLEQDLDTPADLASWRASLVRVTLLAGGVGGARFARGLVAAVDPVA